jgi:hypothetical protein
MFCGIMTLKWENRKSAFAILNLSSEAFHTTIQIIVLQSFDSAKSQPQSCIFQRCPVQSAQAKNGITRKTNAKNVIHTRGLTVSNLERTVEFYQKYFGFEVV